MSKLKKELDNVVMIETAHKAVDRLLSRSVESIDGPALYAAIDALGHRLHTLTAEKEQADKAAQAWHTVANVVGPQVVNQIEILQQLYANALNGVSNERVLDLPGRSLLPVGRSLRRLYGG